jgi:hypothetical protein
MIWRHRECLLAVLAFLSAVPVCFAAQLNAFQLQKSTFQPIAFHACRVVLSDTTLDCTSNGQTLPSCYGTNKPFLCTLALCVQKHSQNMSLAHIDRFWSEYAVGWAQNQEEPNISYLQALGAAGRPSLIVGRGSSITSPSLVSELDFHRAYNSISTWIRSESSLVPYSQVCLCIILSVTNGTISLSLLGCGLLAPILLYVVNYLIPKRLNSKLHAYLIYVTAWPHHWQVSIRDTRNLEPTRGQALYILFTILLNVILTFMYFDSQGGWTWDLRSGRTISAFANRLGALAVANIPLVILYSTRNNFLLWLTGMFLDSLL